MNTGSISSASRNNRKLARTLAALAAGAVLVSGATVGVGAAQAHGNGGGHGPSHGDHGRPDRPSLPTSDRWLEEQVDRTVTDEAKDAY